MMSFRMNHLQRLGNQISVSIPSGEDGLTGRECPNLDCEGYFKIAIGTGLEGEGLPCHCPYCGHTDTHDHFSTQEQIKYVRSIVARKSSDAIRKYLKSLEFDIKPKGPFGIGISMKLKSSGRSLPIYHYRERQLETEIVCESCTLHYSVYGVFAFCPDCRQHNSLQILKKNLDLVRKVVDLAGDKPELAEKLIESALQNCVSAFDGFGRELIRVNTDRASDASMTSRISFQNLSSARIKVLDQFGFDLAGSVPQQTWQEAVRLFQKRHLVVHKMGVIDEDYVTRSGDSSATIGRKILVTPDEVRRLADFIETLSHSLSGYFYGDR